VDQQPKFRLRVTLLGMHHANIGFMLLRQILSWQVL